MTAGRFFLTSPPTAGSKSTHQTSPRFIRHVRDRGLGPFVSFGLAGLVSRHFPVGVPQILLDDMGTDEGLDEAADLVAADDPVKAGIDLLVDGGGGFRLHTCTIRIVGRGVNSVSLQPYPVTFRPSL